MGGQTGRARDNHMAELIKKYLPKASGRDGGDLVAKADAAEPVQVAVAEPANRRRPSRRRKPQHGRSSKAAKKSGAAARCRRRSTRSTEARRRAGLCRARADAQGACRHRSDQHILDGCRRRPAGSIQVASSPSEVQATPCSPRPASRRRDPCRRLRLHRAVRQGRRHLLPRPLRRLRVEDRRPGTPATR